jgi:hypothetical protein
LKSGWLSIYDFGFLLVTISGGKSSVLLDVKPWDDETDMKKLEEAVRSVQLEGLFWGACMLYFTSHFLIFFPLLFIFAHLNIVDCFNIIYDMTLNDTFQFVVYYFSRLRVRCSSTIVLYYAQVCFPPLDQVRYDPRWDLAFKWWKQTYVWYNTILV